MPGPCNKPCTHAWCAAERAGRGLSPCLGYCTHAWCAMRRQWSDARTLPPDYAATLPRELQNRPKQNQNR